MDEDEAEADVPLSSRALDFFHVDYRSSTPLSMPESLLIVYVHGCVYPFRPVFYG